MRAQASRIGTRALLRNLHYEHHCCYRHLSVPQHKLLTLQSHSPCQIQRQGQDVDHQCKVHWPISNRWRPIDGIIGICQYFRMITETPER